MPKPNREILTGGRKYAAKQKAKHRVEEVVFDPALRAEYLTGFHKRKVERQKKAKEYNVEQERLARLEERKRIREERKQDVENQMREFKETMARVNGDDESDEEWGGLSAAESAAESEASEEATPPGILKRKEVYVAEGEDAPVAGETFVTIELLDTDPVAELERAAKANFVDLDKLKEVLDESIDRAKKYAVLAGAAKPKPRKKKFRYLSKAERKSNAYKERGKRHRKD